MLIIFLLSFIIQGSPIFFYQKRLGKETKIFTIIKLRTMKNGKSISAKHDIQRLTNTKYKLENIILVSKNHVEFVPFPYVRNKHQQKLYEQYFKSWRISLFSSFI